VSKIKKSFKKVRKISYKRNINNCLLKTKVFAFLTFFFFVKKDTRTHFKLCKAKKKLSKKKNKVLFFAISKDK